MRTACMYFYLQLRKLRQNARICHYNHTIHNSTIHKTACNLNYNELTAHFFVRWRNVFTFTTTTRKNFIIIANCLSVSHSIPKTEQRTGHSALFGSPRKCTSKEKHSLTRKLVGYRNWRQWWCKKEGNKVLRKG